MPIKKIIRFFTSLKLTVTLLAFCIVLVFVGTLAQVDEGLYNAQARYFRQWFIFGLDLFGKKIPFILPGGYLLGTLLLVNLIAAHVYRFRRAERRLGIFPEMFHAERERQAVNFHRVAGREQTLRNRRYLVAIEENEFAAARILGIIFRLALGQTHLRLVRHHVRHELADEQNNHAAVRELDADFFHRQLKTIDVRAN